MEPIGDAEFLAWEHNKTPFRVKLDLDKYKGDARGVDGLPFTSPAGYKKLLRPANTGKPNMMLPGIYSTDPQFLKFTFDLQRELAKEFPIDVDQTTGLAGPSGVVSDFSKILSCSGYIMDPFQLPINGNRKARKDAGLVESIPEGRTRNIFREVIKAYTKDPVWADLRLAKDSNPGLPYNVVLDANQKKQIWRDATEEVDKHERLITQARFRELFLETDMTFGYLPQLRAQPDRAGKVREVPDIDYAMSGGLKGNLFPASKQIPGIPDTHGAMRHRLVYSAPGKLNYLLTSMMAPFRASALHRYAFTWEHPLEEIAAKSTNYSHVLGMDVKNMDVWMVEDFLDLWLEELQEHWREPMTSILRYMNLGPMVMRNPWRERTGLQWMDNPWDPSTWQWTGLKSGVANNPDFGKTYMVAVYLDLIDQVTHDVLEVGVDTILKGEHDYALLNMSDDCVILCQSAELYKALKDIIKTNPSKIMHIEMEQGISFLGGVFRQDHGVAIGPDSENFLANLLVNERGLENWRRVNYKEGYEARNKTYRYMPIYKEQSKILDYHSIRNFKLDFRSLIMGGGVYAKQKSAREFEGLAAVIDMSNPYDRMVLEKPDSIHYKVPIDKLSPKVADFFIGRVQADKVKKYTQKFWTQSPTDK